MQGRKLTLKSPSPDMAMVISDVLTKVTGSDITPTDFESLSNLGNKIEHFNCFFVLASRHNLGIWNIIMIIYHSTHFSITSASVVMLSKN
jgi:hypothetical protein